MKINNFKEFLYEYVDSKDVGTPESAFMSVVKKDRLVAYLTSDLDNGVEEEIKKYPYLDYIKIFKKGTDAYNKALISKTEFFDSRFQAMKFLSGLYIVYVNTPQGKKNAEELVSIIIRNNGSAVSSISDNYTLEDNVRDHIRVGELLEYSPEKIKEFLLRIKIPIEIIEKLMAK